VSGESLLHIFFKKNFLFHLPPPYQKHPHVIFEARTKQNKGCANSGNLEWRNSGIRRPNHLTGFVDRQDSNGAGRFKRDVRDAPKYIETAIVIDKAMFDKRNGNSSCKYC
jgi:hypothetical protein